MKKIGDAVSRNGKSELVSKYDIVCKDLTRTGHLNKQSFLDYLFEPIVRTKAMKAGYKSRERTPAGNFQRHGNSVRRRSGLLEE